MKYKPEQEAELRAAYESADSDDSRKAVVDEYSAKYAVTRHSIIGKLASMGIYSKPKPLTKSGEPIVAKQEYVNAIRIMLATNGEELESLEKASKRDLKLIMDKLIQLSEKANLRAEARDGGKLSLVA
jgi:hypothetical protein